MIAPGSPSRASFVGMPEPNFHCIRRMSHYFPFEGLCLGEGPDHLTIGAELLGFFVEWFLHDEGCWKIGGMQSLLFCPAFVL